LRIVELILAHAGEMGGKLLVKLARPREKRREVGVIAELAERSSLLTAPHREKRVLDLMDVKQQVIGLLVERSADDRAPDRRVGPGHVAEQVFEIARQRHGEIVRRNLRNAGV